MNEGWGTKRLNAVEAALSRRARVALEAAKGGDRAGDVSRSGAGTAPGRPGEPRGARPGADPAEGPRAPLPGLTDSLRRNLLAGETHYPDRPGMFELRRRVGEALPRLGYPRCAPDGVLITASEGESLFVTLLGLGAGRGTRCAGSRPGRHQGLFDWMGLVRIGPDGSRDLDTDDIDFHYVDAATAQGAPRAHVRPPHDQPSIHTVGSRLFAAPATRPPHTAAASRTPAVRPHDIVIGSLDGLRAMRPFRLGFVAAPPETLARITKWKQASSICSPAPSQRAALWALGVRP